MRSPAAWPKNTTALQLAARSIEPRRLGTLKSFSSQHGWGLDERHEDDEETLFFFKKYGVGTGILVFKARVFLLGGIQGFENAHVQKQILPLPAEKL